MKKRKGRITAKLIISPNPILAQVCEPVEDGEDISGVLRDMRYILSNSKTGVGLAAPQAGHLKRIILVQDKGELLEMINPQIIKYGRVKETLIEGCLSYPGIYKSIRRSTRVWLTWTYFTVSGLEIRTEHSFDGFSARIIQHECDHLDGKCKVGY